MVALRALRGLVPGCVLGLACVGLASAGWAGSDPAKNFPLGKLPAACHSAPAGKECVDAGVYYLDKARARLGETPYQLPADFASLGPARQMFILTNLDRIENGVPPITGLTNGLNYDAYVTGIKAAGDPQPSDPSGEINEWTSNWAGGYENAPLAYEVWMYDDGLGSPNIDCSPSHKAGCWGHRHDILWGFNPSDVLAMGAASGNGPDGLSYALLLVAGFPPDPSSNDPGYTPTYSYTWTQAVADGAGSNAYDPGVPATGCQVPAVVGKPLPAARRLIAHANCRLGAVSSRYARAAPGAVLLESPNAGKALGAGFKVKLTVSRGPRRS